MNKQKLALYDATEHLKLLFADAGLEYQGERFLVPVSKWRKWVKSLGLVEHLENKIIQDQDVKHG